MTFPRRRQTIEKKIQAAVIDHWRVLGAPGSLVAAIPNEGSLGQPGLTKGLPDLLVISPGHIGFIELKREGGKLSPEQDTIIGLIRSTGTPVAVTYGRDEPIEILKEWGAVR